MTWQHVAGDLTRFLQIAALLLVAAFPVRYIAAYPHAWYRTFEGRYMVMSKAAFALILALSPLMLAFPRLGHWAGWPAVRPLVYLVLCGVFVALNIMFSRVRRDARAESDREPVS